MIVLSILSLWMDFSIFSLAIFVLACVMLVLVREENNVENTKEEPEKLESERVEVVEPPQEIQNPDVINFPKDFDEKKFAKGIYLLYCTIQESFMNFEYDVLMKKLGIEMYEQFSKQMKHLEESSRQSVRTNIELQKIQVMSYQQGKDKDTAVVQLSVLEDKYMKKKEEPFRLTSARVRYESCYSLTVIKHHRKKMIRKCSNCGEKLQGNPSQCPICSKMLLESSEDWILKDLQLVCSHSYSAKKES